MSNIFRWKRAKLITGVLAALLAIASIAGVAGQEGNARVRIIHASPDAPAVDIYVDGSMVVENLAFTSGTDYLEVPAGDHQVQVTPTGSSPDEAVIDANVTLEAGADYTVAAIGQVANIQPLVLMDNNSAPAEGMAHVRVVHASPDAPAVDIAVTGGPVLLENLSFGSASNYTPVDAMTYDLEVRPTGTQDAAIEIPGFSAEAGTVYTVFAMGLAGDGTLQPVPFVDAQTGMGGGDVGTAPGMPSTGAGGTVVTDSSSVAWTTIAAVAAVVAVVASGTIILGSRKLRA